MNLRLYLLSTFCCSLALPVTTVFAKSMPADSSVWTKLINNPAENSPQIQITSSTAATYIPDVAPSITSSSRHGGVQTHTQSAYCNRNGVIVRDCIISIIEVYVTPNSGGHDHHSSSRSSGIVTPLVLYPDANGKHTFTVEAPEEAGTINVRGVGTSATYPNSTFGGVIPIEVGIGGLIPLPSGSTYTLIGQTTTHADNHYGRLSLVSSLQAVAQNFHQLTWITIGINDMSLMHGGLFDVRANWAPPHGSHRVGEDADIRNSNIPLQDRQLLQNIFRTNGFTVLNEGNHWHVRLP